MKLFVLLTTAAVVCAQADSTGYFPGEPSCAIPCLTSAITAAGCQLSDIVCQCGPTQSVIANKVGSCILTSCTNPAELGDAINAGQAVCSSFSAGQLSFTQPSSPTPTPTSTSSPSNSTSVTSMTMTNPPTPTPNSSETRHMNTTTLHGTHTDTLIGPGPTTPLLSGSLTDILPTSSPTGAAANPTRIGAGILAGIAGIVAFL
ncbi:hypothetical protein F4808DRAFT_95915 [Astrocystis sublimbata]|nr:hypothetical protein F4808DRAFT_95915 [Astrocystis sublimbata]